MSALPTSDLREEGEELGSSPHDPSPPPSTHSPQSPDSPSQQKRRRYDDETHATRRDRTDRADEHSQPDRRSSDLPQSASAPTASSSAPAMDDDRAAASAEHAEDAKDSTELRLLLESVHVGAIIGKGGEVIKRLREDNACYINILKVSEAAGSGGSRERVMVMKGSNDAVLRTLAQIIDLQIESQNNREKREHGEDAPLKDATQIRLLVHRTTVGAVIGKEGNTIRQTSSSTGARVQVSGEALPHSSEKTVAISGTKEQVNSALALVVGQIKSNPPKAGTKVTPYVPGAYGGFQQQQQQQQQGGYGGGGGYQGQGGQFGGGGGGYGGQQPFGTSCATHSHTHIHTHTHTHTHTHIHTHTHTGLCTLEWPALD